MCDDEKVRKQGGLVMNISSLTMAVFSSQEPYRFRTLHNISIRENLRSCGESGSYGAFVGFAIG